MAVPVCLGRNNNQTEMASITTEVELILQKQVICNIRAQTGKIMRTLNTNLF